MANLLPAAPRPLPADMEHLLTTRDTDLAAALLAQGARLRSWERDGGGIVHWALAGHRREWVADFKSGADGAKRLFANRKNLIRIAASFPQPGGLAYQTRGNMENET